LPSLTLSLPPPARQRGLKRRDDVGEPRAIPPRPPIAPELRGYSTARYETPTFTAASRSNDAAPERLAMKIKTDRSTYGDFSHRIKTVSGFSLCLMTDFLTCNHFVTHGALYFGQLPAQSVRQFIDHPHEYEMKSRTIFEKSTRTEFGKM
jgi:hypothetical protein